MPKWALGPQKSILMDISPPSCSWEKKYIYLCEDCSYSNQKDISVLSRGKSGEEE